MRRSSIIAVCLALVLNLAAAVPGAWAGEPTEVVKTVIERSLEILKNPSYGKSERRRLVKQAVDTRFDYREMAKRSLGPTWRTLSGHQRDDFVRLFSELLEASYSDKIEKYSGSVKIDYVAESLDNDYAEVRTMAVRPNDRIPMNYRLLNESGKWMVYDVSIEGVSLVSNYRSQFSRVINENSYGELVRRLRDKVEELKSTGGA